MDEDLLHMDRDRLVAEVMKRLRAGIRAPPG